MNIITFKRLKVLLSVVVLSIISIPSLTHGNLHEIYEEKYSEDRQFSKDQVEDENREFRKQLMADVDKDYRKFQKENRTKYNEYRKSYGLEPIPMEAGYGIEFKFAKDDDSD